MKVIICGGRTFRDEILFRKALKAFQNDHGKIKEVISGGALGADSLAIAWARNNNIKCTICQADWQRYKKMAGPIRNNEMINLNPDWVIAFPGGSGTRDMVDRARGRYVKVKEVSYESVSLQQREMRK